MTTTPFNYASDGTFVRASDAWAIVPDAGASAQVSPLTFGSGVRRVFVLADGPWILIEGERTNLVDEPIDWVAGTGWTGATGPDNVGNPQEGPPFGASPHVAGTADEVLFATGGPTVVAACSAFFLGVAGGTVSLSVTNTAESPTAMALDNTNWKRARHKASLPGGGTSKALHITGSNKHGWGAQVELGPSSSAAFFPSHPILTGNATRLAEKYLAGQFTVADLAASDGVRIKFRPVFASTDVRSTDEFAIWSVVSGVNKVGVSVTSVLDGTARISGGLSPGAINATVTFAADQEITVSIFESGLMRVDGATTGNGSYSGGAFVVPSLVDVSIGSYVPAGTALQLGFALIGPLQLINQALLTGGEQLTLNSVRLTFDHAPVAFDRNGVDDALNRDYYAVTGTPGLPLLQHVALETPTSVLLYFDAKIPAGDLVVISVSGFTTAPGSFSFLAFGAEVDAAAAREVVQPRVDIANPQTERDAGEDTLGTFSVTETGDLVNDFGRAGLRKRCLRRISTMRAGFPLLPDYGLAPRSKGLVTPTLLRRLQLDAESQISQEPGVVAVRASVSEVQPGLVNIRLRVQDDSGAFEIDAPLDLTGG